MESYYKFTVSKARVISKMIWCWILIISIPFIEYNQDQLKFFYNTPNAFVMLFVIVITLLIVSILASTIYNGIKFLKFDLLAELEIFNDYGYLIYRNFVDGQIKEIKVNLEDIYFIKRNFCKTVYLYYDEIFYTENKVINKIIIPISLVYKIEKKINTSKQIKITEYFEYLYHKLPTSQNVSNVG